MILIERTIAFPQWITYTLFCTLILVAISKYRFNNALSKAIIITFSIAPFHSSLNTEKNIFGKNWELYINFFIVSTIAAFMILSHYEIEHKSWMFIPVFYYAFQLITFAGVGFLYDELDKMSENIKWLNIFIQQLGVFLIPVLLIWLAMPELSELMIIIVISLFIILNVLRVLRGVWMAIHYKILWYHIILYLCTFEIWWIFAIYAFWIPIS